MKLENNLFQIWKKNPCIIRCEVMPQVWLGQRYRFDNMSSYDAICRHMLAFYLGSTLYDVPFPICITNTDVSTNIDMYTYINKYVFKDYITIFVNTTCV